MAAARKTTKSATNGAKSKESNLNAAHLGPLPEAYKKLPPLLSQEEERDLFVSLEKARDAVVDSLSSMPQIIEFYGIIAGELMKKDLKDLSRFISPRRAAELAFPKKLTLIDKETHSKNKNSARKKNQKRRRGSKFSRSLSTERKKLQEKLEAEVCKRFRVEMEALPDKIADLKRVWDYDLPRDENDMVRPDTEAYQLYKQKLRGIADVLKQYPLRRKHQKPLQDSILEKVACVRGHGVSIEGKYRAEEGAHLCVKDIRTAGASLAKKVERVVGLEKRLAERNIRLCIKYAREYARSAAEFHDLIDEGIVGLCAAHELYQYRTGNKFSTYATWWIRQAIQRDIESRYGLPAHLIEFLPRVKQAFWRLKQENGVCPSAQDIVDFIDDKKIKVSHAKHILDYINSATYSYDKIVEGTDDLRMRDLIEDPVNDGRRSFERVARSEVDEAIQAALSILTDRERTIIVGRFGLNGMECMTLDELVPVVGVTKERVRQLEMRALRRLQKSSYRFALAEYFGMGRNDPDVQRLTVSPNLRILNGKSGRPVPSQNKGPE